MAGYDDEGWGYVVRVQGPSGEKSSNLCPWPLAFASTQHNTRPIPSSSGRSSSVRNRGALTAVVDPHEAASFLHTQLPTALEQSQWLLQALQGLADAAVSAAEPATDAAKAAATNNGGWLAAPISAIEKSISFIHEVRASVWDVRILL